MAGLMNPFSMHPPLDKRIERLREMRYSARSG
jgi:Zn-dependent protease with chaperone function